MILSRRSLITGLAALVAAPAVIRTPGLLMPVRTIVTTPCVFDPVEMAASVVSRLGKYEFTGKPMSYWRQRDGHLSCAPDTVQVQMGPVEARKRVLAWVSDPAGLEYARTDATEFPNQPPRADRLRPAAEVLA